MKESILYLILGESPTLPERLKASGRRIASACIYIGFMLGARVGVVVANGLFGDSEKVTHYHSYIAPGSPNIENSGDGVVAESSCKVGIMNLVVGMVAVRPGCQLSAFGLVKLVKLTRVLSILFKSGKRKKSSTFFVVYRVRVPPDPSI